MNRIEISERNIVREFASDWTELKPEEAKYAGELLLLLEREEISLDVFRKLMVDRLLNIRTRRKKLQEGDDAWNFWGNLDKLGKTMDFFFKKTEQKDHMEMEVDPCFISPLIPHIRMGLRKYFAPRDLLFNLTFIEFKDCIVYASKYIETRDLKWLCLMTGILYRRRKMFLGIRKMFGYKGDDRVKDTPYRRERFTRRLSRKSDGIPYITYLFFSGCLQFIKEEAVEIDGQEFYFKILFSGGGEDNDGMASDPGLTGVLYSLAESGVFGDVEATANANLYDVLLRLYQSKLEADRLKR